VTFAELRGDLVILACAISAGIYGALASGEAGTRVGAGFVTAAAALAGLVLALTL
jgi:drug/metabolite transporter (DMT)-like permease